jgi:hypothetical protein
MQGILKFVVLWFSLVAVLLSFPEAVGMLAVRVCGGMRGKADPDLSVSAA